MKGFTKNTGAKKVVIPALIVLLIALLCACSSQDMLISLEESILQIAVESTPAPPDREFSERLNLYYSHLTADERDIYAQFVEAAESMQTEFVPCHSILHDHLDLIYAAVCYDQVQLFWLDEHCSCLYAEGTGEITEIQMHYTVTVDELPIYQECLETAAQTYLDAATGLNTEERERVIHDLLCQNIRYDTGMPTTQSVYNALVDGYTACAGFARAFRYLMTELDIPCCLCFGQGYGGDSDSGYTWGDHAWNIIRLGDSWYNVDVTWDTTSMSPAGLISYAFYNRTDEDFSEKHIRDSSLEFLPACTATEYSCENLYGWAPELMFAEQLGIQTLTDVYSLQDYYDACLLTLKESGGGQSETAMLVHGESCLDAITDAINSQEYKDAYIADALRYLDWNGCSFHLETRTFQAKDEVYLFVQYNTLTAAE